jgi:hypothetical protein
VHTGLLAGLMLALAACGSGSGSSAPAPTPTATPTPVPTPEARRYLFLLYSDAGELVAGTGGTWLFRMRDAWDTVVAFTDRPFRDAVAVPLREWIAGWSANGFTANPPNAAVTMLVDGVVQETDWAVLTLRNPRFTPAGDLEFDTEFLRLPDGNPAFFPTVLGSGVKPEFLTTQVFIDSTGAVIAPPDQLTWQVNGRSDRMLTVAPSGYVAGGSEEVLLVDPQERFCTGANVRPSIRLDLDDTDCDNGDCTIAIGEPVTPGQVPIVRIPGSTRSLTAGVSILTYEECDASRPLTLPLADAVHFPGPDETATPVPTPTATATATEPPASTATPTLGPETCSVEDELGISRDGGWLPLADPACTVDRVADVGSSACPRAWVDGSQARAFGTEGLASVRVHGNGILAVTDTFTDEQGPVTLHLSRIEVAPHPGESTSSSPRLVIGTARCPIRESTVTLSFHGDPADPADENYIRNKGIVVGEGGRLILHGGVGVVPADTSIADSKGTVSWTYLTEPAGPAKWSRLTSGIAVPVPDNAPDTTLRVAKAVDWRPGDWIVVASTDFSEDHQEFVQIESIVRDPAGDVATITLNPETPLQRYHFGGPAPTKDVLPTGLSDCNGVDPGDIDVTGLPGSFCDGGARNFGVDERAEVGLLSRAIRLTARTSPAHPHYGGQIRIEPGVAEVRIEGVELENFGQAIRVDDHQSAYPIHFHHVHAVPDGSIVNSNSIHHTFNKCVVLHDTDDLTVEHNVCARNIGHAFYLELGSETGNSFHRNLVAGAMAPAFTPDKPEEMWPGDYLAARIGYDGIDVEPTSPDEHGERLAPSGFWIAHPDNAWRYNSVAGCQLQGRGYWIMPQTQEGSHSPFPENGFDGNRVHGCYDGIDSGADAGAVSPGGFVPQVDGKDVIARLTNVTVTRVRNKGIWLRPGWYHVDGARIATTRDGVSLVSAGGVEGSPPGEWALLSNSVLVGISNNNPERFGPCPVPGGDGSCYGMRNAGANGFPNTHWNVAGFMFYDGPARLETVRFVNFNETIDPYLTADDRQVLAQASPPYEGDAALGWFQSNVNNYPPTQYTQGLLWENTDFRHQVYTEEVNLAPFVDGDKNTVILDRDGTLSGYRVVDADGNPVPGRFPISLNNLAFNAIAPASGPLTVDECGAIGAQDRLKENRPTALMSPEAYATLEFTAWNPTLTLDATVPDLAKKAPLTFIKDQQDYVDYAGSVGFEPWSPHHYGMTLVGRNLTQVREPKVMRGAGYTVHSFKPDVAVGAYAEDGVTRDVIAQPHALPRFVSAVLTDVTSGPTVLDEGREVFAKPFRIRLGLCYRSASGYLPPDASSFLVERGRVSLGGPIGTPNSDAYAKLACNNFLFQDPANYVADADADPTLFAPECPAESTVLEAAPDWESFEAARDGYFYDADKGMLFFYVEQEEPNAIGAAPIGSCSDDSEDAACAGGREFYSCPAGGCMLYTVRVTDPNYRPITGNYGPTDCTDVYDGSTGRDYTDTYPPNGTLAEPMDRLAYVDGSLVNEIEAVSTNPAPDSPLGNFPHAVFNGDEAAICPVNRTGPNNPTEVPLQATYLVVLPGGDTGYQLTSVRFVAGDGTVVESATGRSITLDLGKSWTMTVQATHLGTDASCSTTISTSGTPAAPGWSRGSGGNDCLMQDSGIGTIALGPF